LAKMPPERAPRFAVIARKGPAFRTVMKNSTGLI